MSLSSFLSKFWIEGWTECIYITFHGGPCPLKAVFLFVHSCVCSIIPTDGSDELLRGPWEVFFKPCLVPAALLGVINRSGRNLFKSLAGTSYSQLARYLCSQLASRHDSCLALVSLRWASTSVISSCSFFLQPSDIVDEPSSIVWLLLWCDLELMLYYSPKHRFNSEIDEIKHYSCLIWCLFLMSYWVGPLKGNCGLSVWTGNTDVCQEHPSKLQVYVLEPNGSFSFWWHLTYWLVLEQEVHDFIWGGTPCWFSDSLCAVFSTTLEIPPMAFCA